MEDLPKYMNKLNLIKNNTIDGYPEYISIEDSR
jgi:hypothetical protein